MTAPVWLNAVVGDFGRGAGLGGLALDDRGVVVLRFETGAALRLEYTGVELVIAVTVPVADVKRLLALAHPKARHGFIVRTGVVRKTQEGVLAVRLAERDVTLPQVSSVFSVLWRLASEVGGAR